MTLTTPDGAGAAQAARRRPVADPRAGLFRHDDRRIMRARRRRQGLVLPPFPGQAGARGRCGRLLVEDHRRIVRASAPITPPPTRSTAFLGYIDFRKALIAGAIPEFTCLVGTMTQEVYQSHPAIRDACEASISGHAETLVADIAAAMQALWRQSRFYAREPRFAYAGGAARGVRRRQGQGRGGGGDRERRSLAPLCRIAVQGRKSKRRVKVAIPTHDAAWRSSP